MRRSVPRKDRYSAGASRLTLRSEEGRDARATEPDRKARLPHIRVGHDASAHLRDGGTHRPAFADSENRTGARVDQPARASAHAEEKLPRYLGPPLMSRENILHRVRTALGRSEGQPPASAPTVRLRPAETDRETRISSMLDRVEALAGKTYRAS